MLWGATRIVLVGFDMGALGNKDHFFGEHPAPLFRQSPYATFRRAFLRVADDCRAMGVKVINASPRSHLESFPKMTLQAALDATRTG